MTEAPSADAVLTTRRLSLRLARPSDAGFVLELLNDPAWLANIGDRGVHDLSSASAYIENNLLAMHRQHGFCLYVVTDDASAEAMGLCGILKRPTLQDPDLGYALLPQFRGQGYAREAAAGVLAFASETLNIPRLVAITLPANMASCRLLEKLDFRFESSLPADDGTELALYAWQAQSSTATG